MELANDPVHHNSLNDLSRWKWTTRERRACTGSQDMNFISSPNKDLCDIVREVLSATEHVRKE